MGEEELEEELVEEAHLLFGPVVDNGDEEAVILRGAAGPREEVHLRGVVVLHVVHLGWGEARSQPTWSLVESQTFFLTRACLE